MNASTELMKEYAQRALDAEARVRDLEAALQRATYLAENLHGMIDRQTWRDTGGDDGQGHYEGDYHAAKVADEIRELAALAAVPDRNEDARGETWDCGCPFEGPHNDACAFAAAGGAEGDK